jgi:hypothetical protein
MRAHTTTASMSGGRTNTQLATNHRALTNQFDFPQLYAVMVVDSGSQNTDHHLNLHRIMYGDPSFVGL